MNVEKQAVKRLLIAALNGWGWEGVRFHGKTLVSAWLGDDEEGDCQEATWCRIALALHVLDNRTSASGCACGKCDPERLGNR